MTDVYAFYGFKGGTGRSLVMAHIAAILAAEKKKVLVIDADLEAPGLGDFFDSSSRATFERWRGRDGLMDLMRELVKQQDRGGLGDDAALAALIRTQILRILDDGGLLWPDRGSSRNSMQSQPSVSAEAAAGSNPHILGPGNHRASSDLGAQRYVANFLDFDWNAFLRQSGPRILQALGDFWRGGIHGFDYVLIDTRTGYNLPSILLIQNWATHLIGISSWSWQSIDGMARMLPVAQRVQWRDEPIPTFLVMNKTASENPDADVIKCILTRYFEADTGGIKRIDMPYAYLLQARDHMAWDTLNREQYLAARKRRNAPERLTQNTEITARLMRRRLSSSVTA